MRMRQQYLVYLTLFAIIARNDSFSARIQPKDKKKNYENITQVSAQAIHSGREVIEERSWDDFPVVHDYFYESEDSYFDSGGSRREYSNDFQPLCQNVRRRIELRSELYEYNPSHYVETVCRKFTVSGLGELSRNTYNQMCSQPGFTCVQRTQTVYLTRKRYDSGCWESTKEVIASGCDCMWPLTALQDRDDI